MFNFYISAFACVFCLFVYVCISISLCVDICVACGFCFVCICDVSCLAVKRYGQSIVFLPSKIPAGQSFFRESNLF